jgi:lipoprotein-anchoring transpeptidase ErfK/SrfK
MAAALRTITALLLAAGIACTTAPASTPTPVIAPGVAVLGIPVGGLSSEPARDKIDAAFARPIHVVYGKERLTVPPQKLGAGAAVDAAVTSALAATPRSKIGLPIEYSKHNVSSFVRWLARRYYRPAEDSKLLGVDSYARPVISEAKTGTAVRAETMRVALEQQLRTVTRTPLRVLTRPVPPRVTPDTFGDVIVIVRGSNTLSLYSGRQLIRSFGVATGQAEYPTPSGTYEIVDKQRDPWWRPPDSEWAKDAEPIPPGPGNPLGTRWMGLTAPGVGIHGTPDDASIGYSASHGCIRMLIPEATWLFDHVRIGTPVLIVDT